MEEWRNPMQSESEKLLGQLKSELRVAIPPVYSCLLEEFPDMYGFAIGTTLLFEFLVPVYQRKSDLPAEDHERYASTKFWPPNWAVMNQPNRNDTFGDSVAQALRRLKEHRDAPGFDDWDLVDCYADSILHVLAELDADGELGAKTDERYLTIWIAGSDERCVINASEKLNTPTLHARVLEM